MTIQEFEASYKRQTIVNHGDFVLSNLQVGHYGYETTDAEKEKVDNKSPAFRLHYIINGKVTLYVGQKTYTLNKNHCYLIRPDIETSYQTLLTPPYTTYYWVTVSGSYAKYLLTRIGFTEEVPYFYIPTQFQRKFRASFFDNFNINDTTKETTDFIFIENLMKIVRILYLTAHIDTPKVKKKQPAYIEKALTYFNENFTSPDFGIQELASRIFVHPNYLATLFKREMGATFNEYLIQRRIEYAISLMELGHTKVKQIAEMVGIPDAAYFSKIYKKLEKISPGKEIQKQKAKRKAMEKEPVC